jgi:hypothetical protein
MTTNDAPRPKPAPPKKTLAQIEATTPLKVINNEKPKYVRKPHLTDKPFKNDPVLGSVLKMMKDTEPEDKQPKDLRPKALGLQKKGYSVAAIAAELHVPIRVVKSLIHRPGPSRRDSSKEKN